MEVREQQVDVFVALAIDTITNNGAKNGDTPRAPRNAIKNTE